MLNPVSTYRFQFHKEFTFEQFERLIPYLQKLGVVTVYASPVFTAVPGSTHGYDGINPHLINPEIGTEEKLRELSAKLRSNEMNWLQDIVPNHMAFDPHNEWLMDVLEKGPQSPYAIFFDEAWSSVLYRGRLMVPFLGKHLNEALDAGEIKISLQDDRLGFSYYSAFYPVQPGSYMQVLKADGARLPKALSQFLDLIPKMEDSNAYLERWNEARAQLASLYKHKDLHAYINKRLDQVNADKTLLRKIADTQSYELCYWQETDHRITYRRFFTVNGLICLNIQDEKVFDAYHQKIRQFLEEGVFKGLRVDHIDGLFDPTQYVERLRNLAGDNTYIIVEKILEPGEGLPSFWPLQGNTGYDFLSLANNLFTKKENEQAFTQFYDELTENYKSIHQLLQEKKTYILQEHMRGELDNLYSLFLELNLVPKKTFSAVRKEELKEAIAEFLIHCPVYRYYGNRMPLEGMEASAIQNIFDRIRNNNDDLRQSVGVLEDALLRKPQEGDQERNDRALYFYQRCMQFSGPLMAKGVEDTLMYVYNRFVAHNEVGDSLESFGITVDEFHQAMAARQDQWPLTLNATATHDTKRGEDVRARLNVISELPEAWMNKVNEWQGITHESALDANDKYFIYQNLAGALPMSGMPEDDFENRFKAYLEKALREAKLHSTWTAPNIEYEQHAKDLVSQLLDQNGPFWKSFKSFFARIVDHGIVNSLSQLLLKFTCPGVPDTYQGCECWDLSFVDPDNRRSVDYAIRQRWLEETEKAVPGAAISGLWEERYSGKIKFWLLHRLMQMRREYAELFLNGEYMPLRTEGKYKDNVIAYARRYRKSVLVVTLPLFTASLCAEQKIDDPLTIEWADTTVTLPDGVSPDWQLLLRDQSGTFYRQVPVKELFGPFPFGIALGQYAVNKRGAGLLLHITSLPSPFGVGDLGPEAKAFAGYLHKHHQKYWQLLPLNPTEEGQGNSPYSSISSRAGNMLLISPELLLKDGLLQASDIRSHRLPQEGRTNYKDASAAKEELFSIAWHFFNSEKGTLLTKDFADFKDKQASWLHDFALYVVLKKKNDGKPWYEWESSFKDREPDALEALTHREQEEIEKTKWLQFIFFRQWQQLKEYCNRLDIQLIGDMPFYVSYDSADVWSHKQYFALDAQGRRTGMAGVPPDAFSDDGQLWGMPVFRWDVLKEHAYDWWVERLQKNIELFDLVRLDHFRAFAAYWEVPAGETTARKGSWKPGPGAGLFQTAQKQLGELPFIAEDLGDIDETVYLLRDAFGMPGMKVLQFAFGQDLPASPHIPHNYSSNFIVYTGTHDNNTTRGWFRQEARKERQRIEQYLARPVTEEEIDWQMGRLAYGSVAEIAILPVQDILDLDEHARMNKPSSGTDNWTWRLRPGQLTDEAARRLDEWVYVYNRK